MAFASAGRVLGQPVSLFSTQRAFGAVKSDGSVVTWGDAGYGGDSHAVQEQLSGDVQQIFSNWGAFAAVNGDGSVVTWGDADFGGESHAVHKQLSDGVWEIFSNGRAFAAMKVDGSVVTKLRGYHWLRRVNPARHPQAQNGRQCFRCDQAEWPGRPHC